MTEQDDSRAESDRGATGGPSTDGDQPLLMIDGVTKTFGSVISLQDISTTVRSGAVTCIGVARSARGHSGPRGLRRPLGLALGAHVRWRGGRRRLDGLDGDRA